MKKQISALKRKIKNLKEKHSKIYASGYARHGGNMNAVRFELNMIHEQILFAERQLFELTYN